MLLGYVAWTPTHDAADPARVPSTALCESQVQRSSASACFLLPSAWHQPQGGIDSERYMVMRGLFQLRARHHRARAFVDNLHYTNVCENAMEIDIANVVAHGYLQVGNKIPSNARVKR